MHEQVVNWFEFELHKRQNHQKVKIPAEDYKDALNKIKRIHPDCMVSFVRQWTQTEATAQPPPIPKRKPTQHTKEASTASRNQHSTSSNQRQQNNDSAKAAGPPYWKVLGVDEHAQLSTIKKAYVQRLKEYHPDRVADMGPEIKKLAEQKTFEILNAFNDAQRALRKDNQST